MEKRPDDFEIIIQSSVDNSTYLTPLYGGVVFKRMDSLKVFSYRCGMFVVCNAFDMVNVWWPLRGC